MIKTLDELMYMNDGIIPFNNIFWGNGGLGYKPNKYNMVGGYLTDDESIETDDEGLDDMAFSYLVDTLNEYNRRFDDLNIEEYKEMRNLQNQVEDFINDKEELDEDDEFLLNEIYLSRKLIDKVIKDYDNRYRYIHRYDIERGFKEDENKNIITYEGIDEESEDEEIIISTYKKLMKKKKLNENEKKYLEYLKTKIPKYFFLQKKGGRIIKGGMAFQNINTGLIDHELFDTLGINNLPDLIDEVMGNTTLTDEQKYNFLLKEASDVMVDLKKKADIDDNKELKDEVEESKKKLIEELNKMRQKGYKKTPEQKEALLTITKDKSDINFNPHFHEEDKKAVQKYPSDFFKKNTERGDITEEDLTNNFKLFDFVDKDNSSIYNTKNFDAYNPDFINALLKITLADPDYPYIEANDFNDIPKRIKDFIYEKFLKFVPVDFVKDNTIWETKSFSKPILDNTKKQEMKEQKIIGYNNNPILDLNSIKKGIYVGNKNDLPTLNYDFKYKTTGKENKVDNIYFNFDGKIKYFGKNKGKLDFKNIHIFRNKPKGYNYYWLYDNNDKLGYYNPLKKDNYKEIESQLNNSKQKLDDKGKKVIEVENKNIRIMPYSYSHILTEHHQKKNKNLDSLKKFNSRVFKDTINIKKK